MQTSNGIWLAAHGVAEQVRPEVFALVERRAGDLAMRTFSVYTQGNLHGRLTGHVPESYEPQFRAYRRFADSLDVAALRPEDRRLPDSFYAPFDRFVAGIRQVLRKHQ